MHLDVSYKFYLDSGGRDPDLASPTLRRYHRLLWSKPLPCGRSFSLDDTRKDAYLHHQSDLGEFFLGSDAITHSYRNHKRKRWITDQIKDQVEEFFEENSSIASYVIFPNKRVGGQQTMNQARGVSRLIDDRFDLTLECIRRHYAGEESPLSSTIKVYEQFFALFGDFDHYVRFFLLDDLIDARGAIKFYLPFDDFRTHPNFSDVSDYLAYKARVSAFVSARKRRILEYVSKA